MTRSGGMGRAGRGGRGRRRALSASASGSVRLLLVVASLLGPGASLRVGAEPRANDATSYAQAEGEREVFPGDGRRGRAAGPVERGLRRKLMRGLEIVLPEARPIERLAILREARSLPRAERRALGRRILRAESLAPAQREALAAELTVLLERANEDVERFERNLDRWERLPEAERERHRARLRRLREMPLDERLRLLEEWERARQSPRQGDPDSRNEDETAAD